MILSMISSALPAARTAERRGTRVPASGVDAFYSLGFEQRQARIRNISPTGVFLQTPDRWPSGTTVLLTMKNRSHFQQQPVAEVSMPVKIVRDDDDGVGMEFVLESINTSEWLGLFSKATALTFENDPVRVFRTAKAFAFMLRISPAAEAEILSPLVRVMSQERAERAIDIVLSAESQLLAQRVIPRGNVPSLLLRQMLEEGSRTPDVQMQRYWAGILASACADIPDSNVSTAFVTLLSELSAIHIRILDTVGSKAIQAGWGPGRTLRESLYCSTEEVMELAGIDDLAEIDSAVGHLEDLGLLQMVPNALGGERINLTPTPLGLKLFAMCSGWASEADFIGPAEPKKLEPTPKGFLNYVAC